MEIKKALIFIIFMLVNVVIAHSQSPSNPFDLSYRKSSSASYEAHKEINKKDTVTTEVQDLTQKIDTVESKSTEAAELIPENDTSNNYREGQDPEEIQALAQGDTSSISPSNTGSDGIFPDTLLKKNSLIFGVLLILMLILTTIITLNRQISSRVFKSFMNDNFLNLLLREQKGNISIQYLYLYLFFIINLGLFLFIFIDRILEMEVNITLFNCILFVLIIYLVRYVTMLIIANVFDIKKIASQYNFTIVIFNIFLSFLLLPINLFAAFSPLYIAKIIIYTGLIIIGLVYIFRQLRGLFISSPYINSNKFYFILYFCTVEIAPILVVSKLMGTLFG